MASPGDAGRAGGGRRAAHRALGVDAAQVRLEATHAPAAVAAQLQVAVALVGALHQQRDGLGLGLHVGCAVGSSVRAPRCRAGGVPAARKLRNDGSRLRGARAPASGPFYRLPAPGSARRTLCGRRPLAKAEAAAPTWTNRRPAPWAGGGPSAWARLMQPAAVASPGVWAAAARGPGFGGHRGALGPADTGALAGSGRPPQGGSARSTPAGQPLQIVCS